MGMHYFFLLPDQEPGGHKEPRPNNEPGGHKKPGPKPNKPGGQSLTRGQSLTAFCKIFGGSADFEVNFLAL